MAKFRVDADEIGNPEVSAKRPVKLAPIDGDEAAPTKPKSAMKGALKGSKERSEPPDASASNEAPKSAMKSAPKSAMKSAMKQPAIPEPDEEPAAAATPVPRKGGLKKAAPPPEEAPQEPPPAPKKGGLKKTAPAQVPDDAQETFQLSPKPPDGAKPKAKGGLKQGGLKQAPARTHCVMQCEEEDPNKPPPKKMLSRPSTFKMTVEIAELGAWTARGLCRHYFYFVAQRMMWEDSTSQADHKPRKSMRLQDMSQLVELQEPAPVIEVAADAISPLKDLFLAKKPDGVPVRALFEAMSEKDRAFWVNAPLDSTPPAMPSPLVFAVAAVAANLVEVLIDFNVDAFAQYPGKSMLKGWVKPNAPLADSARDRKGRFLGTMLGDKLDSIERMLRKAQASASDEVPDSPKPVQQGFARRKSVQMKCKAGVMEHTHDHPSSRYELISGEDGNNSNVREAINIESSDVYAIKAGSKIDESCAGDPEAQLWNEIGIIRKVDHPNIVRLHETFENDTHIFMVLEGCLGGELFDRLVEDGAVSELPALRLAYQMGSALRHLHQIQICHRDVQPEAFFLAEEGDLSETGVKMMDFSTAREFSSQQPMFSKVCTLHYVAPEILTSDENLSRGYNERVDIWSLGVLIFTMIAGTPPFNAENDVDIFPLVKEGKFDFAPKTLWDPVSAETKDLIKLCLTVDPAQRPDTWGFMDNPAMKSAEDAGAVYIASDKLGRAAVTDKKSGVNTVKVAFGMIAELITDEQVDELRILFKSLDDTEVGMVEFEDCKEPIKNMVKDNPEAGELLKLLDQDNAGRVNYQMYICTMTDRRRQLRREAARAVFNSFDIDKNGNISIYEIAQALSKGDDMNGMKTSANMKGEVQKIWKDMGTIFMSGDNKQQADEEMTFDEFFKRLHGDGYTGF